MSDLNWNGDPADGAFFKGSIPNDCLVIGIDFAGPIPSYTRTVFKRDGIPVLIFDRALSDEEISAINEWLLRLLRQPPPPIVSYTITRRGRLALFRDRLYRTWCDWTRFDLAGL
jgi:hypothetical protein